MATKTEDEVRGALEKALGKHTKKDGTIDPDNLMSAIGDMMADPDMMDAFKDVATFIDETNEETIENWKKVGEEE